MPALVAGINVFLAAPQQDVGGQDKPGHDSGEMVQCGTRSIVPCGAGVACGPCCHDAMSSWVPAARLQLSPPAPRPIERPTASRYCASAAGFDGAVPGP